MTTTTVKPPNACPYCSSETQYVFHQGWCPKIKSIEYHPNGTIKKIELKDDK